MCLNIFAATLFTALAGAAPVSKDGEPDSTPRIAFSRETIRVTDRLEGGLPDYVGALNRHYGQGATPENNANVPFWRASGRHFRDHAIEPVYFERMGVEPPPDDGDYYLGVTRYLRERVKLDPSGELYIAAIERQDQSKVAPWTEQDFPLIAGWLSANEKPLSVLTVGMERPRYFSPVVEGDFDDALREDGVLTHQLMQQRQFGNALISRAMLHVGEGRAEAAWEDILTCHRMMRRTGSGATVMEGLVANAVEGVAAYAGQRFVYHHPPSGEQARRYLADLASLPPATDFVDKYDSYGRYGLLRSIVLLAEERLDLDSLVEKRDDRDILDAALAREVDWNEALRTANRWYDALVAAAGEPDRMKRREQVTAAGEKLAAATTDLRDGRAVDRRVASAADPAAEAGRIVGDLLTQLHRPQVAAAMYTRDRIDQLHRNLKLAIALAAWRREHDSYPEKLDKLFPDYLKEIPLDVFSGGPMIYIPVRDGYLLYSVGMNGEDGGGNERPPGWDIVVEVPPPPPR